MSDLMRKLKPFLDAEPGEPLACRDPVNAPMIRHWCDAMGDENPVYTDPEFAEKSAHGGLVSPPTMLQAWTMPGLMRRGERSGSGGWNVLRILDEAGFTSVVATNCRQEYRRYLRPGDRLSATTSWADISDEKQTALGAGHFITQRVTYRDQNGEVVGTMDFRMLKFRPKAAPPPEAGTAKPEATQRTPRRPRPSSNQDTAFFWEGLREGRLRVRACAACGKLRHPPEPMCPSCGSLDWNLVDCSGRGHVYSFVVAHHPPVPPFAYPHVVALVELEEGVRIVAELAGVTREQVEIGMPVQAVFEPAAPDDDLVVPRFRPAGSQESRS